VSVLSVVVQWEGMSAAPVSRQGAGCRACHPSLFNCQGLWHWHLALARVLAALAAQGRSNSGASDAAVLSRPAGLPVVSVLSVVTQWGGMSAAPVSRQGAGCRACEAHCLLRVTELQERRGEIREAQNDVVAAHLDEEFPVHDWCFQCMTAAVDL